MCILRLDVTINQISPSRIYRHKPLTALGETAPKMKHPVGQAYAIILIRNMPAWNHGLGYWLEECDHNAREQQILLRDAFKTWRATYSALRGICAQGLCRRFCDCCLWMACAPLFLMFTFFATRYVEGFMIPGR